MLLYILPVLSHQYGITTVHMQGAYTTGVQTVPCVVYSKYYCTIVQLRQLMCVTTICIYIYVACLCSMCIVSDVADQMCMILCCIRTYICIIIL